MFLCEYFPLILFSPPPCVFTVMNEIKNVFCIIGYMGLAVAYSYSHRLKGLVFNVQLCSLYNLELLCGDMKKGPPILDN